MTDWEICPRCRKRYREVSTLDGLMEMYCEVCNDTLAENYREAKEFERYHSEDNT